MTAVAPAGFSAHGIAAGIKPSGDLDMTLLASDTTAHAAAMFTTSLTAAPPVQVSRAHVANGRVRAVVVNSGAANAGTGESGVEDARQMASLTADALDCDPGEVLVCSTGPIGGRLPMERIRAGIPALVEGLGRTQAHGLAAAAGIMTTDSVSKTTVGDGAGWRIGGMAKGAGMVRPDLATMLAFLTTDAEVDAAMLTEALRSAADVTFNALNIDGCQSTNDTLAVLASGASGVRPDPDEFASVMEDVCRDLTFQMARDAEGASRVVTLEVSGAGDDRSARRLGMAVADSSLVRASFYGADPNWGRILAALGVAGEKVDPDRIAIAYEGTVVCAGGVAVPFDDEWLSGRLRGDFTVSITAGDGDGAAVVTTTDLTPDYVVFNGERS